MNKKKKRSKEKDFKIAKGYFVFYQFFGCVVAGYFSFKSILEIKSSFEDAQTGWAVLFLVSALFFLYLTINTGKKGIQALKAKKVTDLP